jgi:glycosyltransferase involved in cell wall biosynthesis
MKIWILTSETPRNVTGGIARYVDNFARAAGAEGHEVTVICHGGQRGTSELSPGYRLMEFKHRLEASRHHADVEEPDEHPGWPFNNMCYFAALSYQYVEEVEALVETEGAPDIIECQDYAGLGYFLLQRKLTDAAFLPDTPVVVHLHTPDFIVQQFNQYPRYKLPDYWIGRLERSSILMADTLLSPGRFIADEIQSVIEGDLPEIATIPYPWPDIAQSMEAGPGEELRLVYPGRIELRKGVEPLLAACEKLWQKGLAFTLDMVGGDVHTPLKGGSLTTFLKNKYAHRVTSGNLVFHGTLPHSECLQLMRRAGTVVIPSLWENFPNTCIEAMSLGKVVVASTQGGQAEMVGPHDECGMLFSHNEAGTLEEALGKALSLDDGAREKMGHAAFQRIEALCSPDKVIPSRLEHFQAVIDNHRPKTHYPFVNEAIRNGPQADMLQETPLVSVVIPYYNLGNFIGECVDSVYQSNGSRFEVVIVNDGSTDPESCEALDKLRQRQLPDLRILDIPNGGLANARNIGVEDAKGELVTFLDADDMVGPDFLARATAVMQRYRNVHLVYSWVRFFDGGKGIWHSWSFDLPYLLCHNQLVPIAMVRRATFLEHGRNKSHIIYGLEDLEGWISLAEAGCGGVAIPEALVQYRIRSDSMFKAIEPDKKLYLYDLISSEHPALYERYGLELFNLQNANGPAYAWDQPTMFSAPQDRLLGQLNRAQERLPELEENNKRLSEAEAWYRQTFATQIEELNKNED